MPDLWDTNPDNTFNGSGQKPDSAPNGNNDHTKEVRLRDHRGRLRLPAYVLIALMIALVAILLLLVGVLFAPD
jgi:type VI protein secretion system component VasF